jgi:DNA-binding IclR family transcriptional regulator
VHRILAVLTDEQYVVRSRASRRYFLGPAAREIGAHAPVAPITTIVHPALAKLAAETGETSFVTELIDSRAVCVSLVDGRHPLRLFVRVGQEMPLNAAASARVLLAHLAEQRARELLADAPMTAFTPATPVDVNELIDYFDSVRRRGYDVCEEELDRDVWAVAAPIKARQSSRVVAAVSLAAPTGRVEDPRVRERYVRLVRAAARKLAP